MFSVTFLALDNYILTWRLPEHVLVALDDVARGPPLRGQGVVEVVDEAEVDLPQEELREDGRLEEEHVPRAAPLLPARPQLVHHGVVVGAVAHHVGPHHVGVPAADLNQIIIGNRVAKYKFRYKFQLTFWQSYLP